MMIVSTTLTGSSEEIIGDALRSVVDYVDLCLVIDTGITDATMDVATEVVGPKLRTAKFLWNGDFSDARNFALREAERLGATWALTLDTDERIVTDNPGAWRRLARYPDDVTDVRVRAADGSYNKERFLRTPATGAWKWPVHEAFMRSPGSRAEEVEGLRFAEVPKSAESFKEKFQRDLDTLTNAVEQDPTDARLTYYLAQTHYSCRDYENAALWYERASHLGDWDQQRGFASYRAGASLHSLHRPAEALDLCVRALALSAVIIEAAWMAGMCCYELGRIDHAISWSEMAAAMGRYNGKADRVSRDHLADLKGLYEGPFDVLRFAYKALGQRERAGEAEAHFRRAQAMHKRLAR